MSEPARPHPHKSQLIQVDNDDDEDDDDEDDDDDDDDDDDRAGLIKARLNIHQTISEEKEWTGVRYYSQLSTFSFLNDDDFIIDEDDNDIFDHIQNVSFVDIQIVVFCSGSSCYCYVGLVYVRVTQFFIQHTLSQQSLMDATTKQHQTMRRTHIQGRLFLLISFSWFCCCCSI